MTNPEEVLKAEQGGERIFTGEEIMEQIKKRCEKAEFLRELKDGDGIYLFEAKEPGEKSGEYTIYLYKRKGTFGKNSAAKTVIEKLYFENDFPCGGDTIADYDEATGEWVEK